MTKIEKGIPEITSANGNFKRGRKVASDILDAGPGHHTVVEFDEREDDADVHAFVGGARYTVREHPNMKVARRTDKETGIIKIYIINQ